MRGKIHIADDLMRRCQMERVLIGLTKGTLDLSPQDHPTA
jgi:hypothetical protein